MRLSTFSVWSSLLTLVASHSCPDPSEHGARLKPLGQCRDGETTCPYRLTLPPFTVQLPRSFRELEKMARELQSLTRIVDQLREDCRECRESPRVGWDGRTDDGERIQASKGTFNIKETQQDISKGKNTVQVTTSRSELEDSGIMISNGKRADPTALGKRRTISQERIINPQTTKPGVDADGDPKGPNPLQKILINRSTTGEEVDRDESSPLLDLHSEQPTLHERHQDSINVGHEMDSSDTVTAKGKVKGIPEYHVDTTVAEDDDDDGDDDAKSKQLQKPKGDKILGQRRLATGTRAQNNKELKPTINTRNQQDKVVETDAADTRIKEPRVDISDHFSNGNAVKEGRATVTQRSAVKDKVKDEHDIHSASATDPKPFEPGVHSERDSVMESGPDNTAETIGGRKRLASSASAGGANASVAVSQINSQTLEIKSKYASKPDTDTNISIGSESIMSTAETETGQASTRSPISGTKNGGFNASRKNPQTDNKKQLNDGANDTLSGTEIPNLNPVYYADTVSGFNDSPSNQPDVELIISNTQKSNFHTPVKHGMGAGNNSRMDSNSISGPKNSGLPISGITGGTITVSPTHSQILDNNNGFKSGADSEHVAGKDSNPADRNSQSPVSGKNEGVVDVSPTNPQTVHGKNQAGAHSDSGARMNLNLASNTENAGGQKIWARSDGTADPTDLEILVNKNQLETDAESESDTDSDRHTVGNVATVSTQNNSESFVSDRTNSTANVNLTYTQSPGSQNPFTHSADAKGNSGIHSRPFITSESVSQIQTPSVAISVITDARDGTFKKQLKPGTDGERKAGPDLNPPSKVETHSLLQMPQAAKARVNVNQINLQMVNSRSEKSTVASTPVNTMETVSVIESISDRPHGSTVDQINSQSTADVSENLLKPDTIPKKGIYPYQNHAADTPSPQQSLDSRIADSRLNGNDTNPKLPKRNLPKSRLNITQTRNGRYRGSNPASIDAAQKQAPRNNKTTSMRNYAMTSGRHLPTGLVPMRMEERKEITNQPRRKYPTGISLNKDPSHKQKTYILQGGPANESKAFGPRAPKNTSGAVNYTGSNGAIRTYVKTVPNSNNDLNNPAYGITQPVNPTSATGGVEYQSHIETTEAAPAIEVFNLANRLIKSTSPTTVATLDKPHEGSRQDLVNNIPRDPLQSVADKSEGVPARSPLRASSADSNQENQTEQLAVEGVQNRGVPSMESNKLTYSTTTAVTSYTMKTESKGKQGKELTPPTMKTLHSIKENHAERAKTTTYVRFHGRKTPSQEIESKNVPSDPGPKESQVVNNSQGSGTATDVRPNSLDSFQNNAVGPTGIIKASTGAEVSSVSMEHTNENTETVSAPSVMDKVKASTEVDIETTVSNSGPSTYHRYSKTSLGSSGSQEGIKAGNLVDTNNGNSEPVVVNGTILRELQDGHTSTGEGVEKPLVANNTNERRGLRNQPISNCGGECELGPNSWAVVKSRESSTNVRGKPYEDCSDFIIGDPTSGIYSVTPRGSGNKTFPVFCDMTSSGGSWTLIQHRFDGSISFNRTWNDYKQGFGNLKGEFWLGNDKIHWLTSTKAMVLRIELEDLDGAKEYAEYERFHVANESQYYTLTIEGYSGTAGDAMQYSKKFNHNKKNFTTPDRDNDLYTSGNCGAYYSSGWWFDACMAANLNGKYYETRYRGVRNGIFWGTWHNIATESYLTHDRQSFKTVQMMIRPRDI